MEISIDTKKLTDSAYNGSDNSIFEFNSEIIDELVNDITLGNPTCYLVSGYRGAGKSSYIRKIEEKIRKDREKSQQEKSQIVFVYASFAKYKSHTYLLRKLIRGLYQTLIKEENVKYFDKLKKDEEGEDTNKKTSSLLTALYEKTFHEITDTFNKQLKKEREVKIEINGILLISFICVFLISFFNLIAPKSSSNELISIIALIGSSIGLIKEVITLTKSWKDTDSSTEEFERKSLYDEEISDYHFDNLLNGLKDKGFNIVFVLDELDKVEEKEVDALIKEMKPYLVSGVASFIVVAGQDLFYKYKSANSIDDHILSTLFSRIVHVPLMTIDGFTNLFNKLIQGGNSQVTNPINYQPYIDSLIFKSKRIPRKFINLIREEIYWKDEIGYLSIEDNQKKYEEYSKIITSIKKIDEEQIAPSFPDGGLRDYYNMQLLLEAGVILDNQWEKGSFSKNELINELNLKEIEQVDKKLL